MLDFPRGGEYGSTCFCKLVFEVVDIFGVGVTVEVVHNFRHIGDGRGRVSVGHFVVFAFTRN